MTGRERRLLRMLCMTAGGGGGGDKPWEEMTWDDVIAATKNGKYKNFEIGAMKELDLGSEGIVHMQIVGIDVDDLADGSGKAPLTFISKELLKTRHRMNPAKTPASAPYDEGTGGVGGWNKSEMRSYLKNTIKPLIPENARNAIKNVTKYSNSFDSSGTKVMDAVTEDDVWLPSAREINGALTETEGATYYDVYTADNSSRIKTQEGTAYAWRLRTASNASSFGVIAKNGSTGKYDASDDLHIPLGFCL